MTRRPGLLDRIRAAARLVTSTGTARPAARLDEHHLDLDLDLDLGLDRGSSGPSLMTVAALDFRAFSCLVRVMDDVSLSRAWIDSFWSARSAPTSQEHRPAAEMRQSYLDEWERRASEAFGA